MKNIHWAFRGSDEQPREGPFEIIRVHANGTVTMQKGPIDAHNYHHSLLETHSTSSAVQRALT
jgi:hypothetical protein